MPERCENIGLFNKIFLNFDKKLPFSHLRCYETSIEGGVAPLTVSFFTERVGASIFPGKFVTMHFTSIIPTARAREERVVQRRKSSAFYRSHLKRAVDVIVAGALMPVIIPVVAAAAIVIALDGHNPFYSQMRVGKNGRLFRMWKLRSMVHNADDLLENYLSENSAARSEWDATQKLKKDPRITLVGRLLRKTSLDELPQFLNVLRGDMSLVGPRPMMECQKGSYRGKSYFSMRPGITGPWQVSDRNDSEFVDRVRYDDYYENVMCLGVDLRILLRTVYVVVRGTGY